MSSVTEKKEELSIQRSVTELNKGSCTRHITWVFRGTDENWRWPPVSVVNNVFIPALDNTVINNLNSRERFCLTSEEILQSYKRIEEGAKQLALTYLKG
jgi:hypothetical protein